MRPIFLCMLDSLLRKILNSHEKIIAIRLNFVQEKSFKLVKTNLITSKNKKVISFAVLSSTM